MDSLAMGGDPVAAKVSQEVGPRPPQAGGKATTNSGLSQGVGLLDSVSVSVPGNCQVEPARNASGSPGGDGLSNHQAWWRAGPQNNPVGVGAMAPVGLGQTAGPWTPPIVRRVLGVAKPGRVQRSGPPAIDKALWSTD